LLGGTAASIMGGGTQGFANGADSGAMSRLFNYCNHAGRTATCFGEDGEVTTITSDRQSVGGVLASESGASSIEDYETLTVSEVSGFSSTFSLVAGGPYTPLGAAAGTIFLVTGGADLLLNPPKLNEPIRPMMFAIDVGAEVVNQFAPKPVQLGNQILNYTINQNLSE
jgi:hypothetical protein